MGFKRVEKGNSYDKNSNSERVSNSKRSREKIEKNEVISNSDKQIDSVEAEVLSTIFPIEGADVPKGKWQMKQEGTTLQLYIDNKKYEGGVINFSDVVWSDTPVKENSTGIVEGVSFPSTSEPYSSYTYKVIVILSEEHIDSIKFEKTGERSAEGFDTITPEGEETFVEFGLTIYPNDNYSSSVDKASGLLIIDKKLSDGSTIHVGYPGLADLYTSMEGGAEHTEELEFEDGTKVEIRFQRNFDGPLDVQVSEIESESSEDDVDASPESEDGGSESIESITPPKYLGEVFVKNVSAGPMLFGATIALYHPDDQEIVVRNKVNMEEVVYRLPADSLDEDFSQVRTIQDSLAKFSIEDGRLVIEWIEDSLLSMNPTVTVGAGIDEAWNVKSSIDKLKDSKVISLRSEDTFDTIKGKKITGATMSFVLRSNEYNELTSGTDTVTLFKKVRGPDAKEYELRVRSNNVGKVDVELEKTGNYRILDKDGNELLNGGTQGTEGIDLLDEDEVFEWNGKKIIGFEEKLLSSDGLAKTKYEKTLLETLYLTNNVGYLNMGGSTALGDDPKAFAIRASDLASDTRVANFNFGDSDSWKKLDAAGTKWSVVSNEEWEIEMHLEKRVDSQGRDLGREFAMELIRMPSITEEDMTHDWFEGLRNSLKRLGEHEINIDLDPGTPVLPDINIDFPDVGATFGAIRAWIKGNATGKESSEVTSLSSFEDFDPSYPLRNWNKALSHLAREEHIGDLDSDEQYEFISWGDFGPRVHPDILPATDSFLQLHTGLDFPTPAGAVETAKEREVTLVKGGIIDTSSYKPNMDSSSEGHMTIIHNSDMIKYGGKEYYPATRYMHINSLWSKANGVFDNKGKINKGTTISNVPGDHLHMEFFLYEKVGDDLNDPASFSPESREYDLPSGDEIPTKYRGLKWAKGVNSFKHPDGPKYEDGPTVRRDQVDPALFYTEEELGIPKGKGKKPFLPNKMKENQESEPRVKNLDKMNETIDSVVKDFEALVPPLDKDAVNYLKSDMFKLGMTGVFMLESSEGTNTGGMSGLNREIALKSRGPGQMGYDDKVGRFQVSRTQMAKDLKNNHEFYPTDYIKAKLDSTDDYSILGDHTSDLYYNNKSNVQIAMCYMYAKAMRVKKSGHPDFQKIHQETNDFVNLMKSDDDKFNKFLDACETEGAKKYSLNRQDIKKTLKAVLYDDEGQVHNLFRLLSFYNADSTEKEGFDYKFIYAILGINYSLKETFSSLPEDDETGTDDGLSNEDRMSKYGVDSDDLEARHINLDLTNKTALQGFYTKLYEGTEEKRSLIPSNWILKITKDSSGHPVLGLYDDDRNEDDKLGTVSLMGAETGKKLGLAITYGDYDGEVLDLTIHENNDGGQRYRYFSVDAKDEWKDK